MNNYITLFLTILSQLGHLTKEEAEKLDEELQNATIHSSFEAAWEQTKSLFEKLEIETKEIV